MEQRKSFTFFRSFYEALQCLGPEDREVLGMAILGYAFDEILPPLTGVPAAMFLLIKPNLDASRRKAEAGSAGGRAPRQTAGKPQAKAKQTPSTPQAGGEHAPREIEGEIEKEREIEMEMEMEGEREGTGGPVDRAFVPPTLEEVAAFVQERRSPVDAQEFLDFYASKGWLVGSAPMQDWRAACRNAEKWERWSRTPAGTGRSARGAGSAPDSPQRVQAQRQDMEWMDRFLEGEEA